MEPDEFLTGGSYRPMASGPGTEMQPPRAFWGGRLHRGGEEAEPLVGGDGPSPENILGGESFKWDLVTDLDHFFSRLYHYYCNKGFWCIVTQWAMELLTLGFTIVFSGFLILFVNWPWLLQAKCGIQAAEAGHEPCDLVRDGLLRHPLVPMTFLKAMALVYLAMFSAFWAFCFARFFLQLRELLEVREFCHARLGVGEKELQTMSWPDLVERVVRFQSRQRLCIVKELSAHDIVSRIMRKENYTIGMLNKNVLALEMPAWVPGAAPLPGSLGTHKRRHQKNRTRHLVLTKTLEWSLNWCILHHMFDKNFAIRRDFANDPERLKRRLRMVGFGMALVSPFLVVFMLMYFFMRNAEQFYHQPGTVGSRRWSNLAKWRLREFNELDHLFQRRLNASYQHSVAYVKQFPSPIVSMVAKFVSFVTGACAAVLLGVALLDESLLEAQLFDRNLFWYAAIFGTILAVSRSLITEEYTVFDPEAVMQYTARYTHYMPKHWRGKANTDSVRAEFEALFQFKFVLFFEEMASIFITPFLLWFYVPKCVDNILRFVQDFTTHVEGVGHVCSLSAFDFAHHGNSKYGSPCDAAKDRRSTQGKMEKSFLSFVSNYPTWEPPPNGQKMLGMLSTFRTRNEAASSAFPLASSAVLRNSAPYYPPRAAVSHHFSGSYRGVHSRHGGDGVQFGHRLPVPSGRDHPDLPTDSHLGASGIIPPSGANPEEASQLYWLDRYYEAARSTGSGIELDPLSKNGNTEGESAVGVTDDRGRGFKGFGAAEDRGFSDAAPQSRDDVTHDGRFEGDDRPMETRVMISDGRVMGRVKGSDRHVNSEIAGSPLVALNGRVMGLDGRGLGLDAQPVLGRQLSESELDRVLVDQAVRKTAFRGRGVDFGVASVLEEPEEGDEDVSESGHDIPPPFDDHPAHHGRRFSSDNAWPTFGSMQREGAGRADPTGVTSIRFGSGQPTGRPGGSSRGPWGLGSGQEPGLGLQEDGTALRPTGPFVRLQDSFAASSVFSDRERRRPRGRSWAGSGQLAGSRSGSERGGESGRQRGSSRGPWDEGPEGSMIEDEPGMHSDRDPLARLGSAVRSGLWDDDTSEGGGIGSWGLGESGEGVEGRRRVERRSFS